MATAATSSSNFTSNNFDYVVEVKSEFYEDLLPTNQKFITAFSNLHKNSQELWQFVDRFYVSTLKTKELCAAIEEHLHHPTNPAQHIPKGLGLVIQEFFHGLACAYRRQLLMREALQSFRNSTDRELGRAGLVKKASAAFFTAAAASCAAAAAANVNPRRLAVAAAAAAASILLSAAGSWMHSFLSEQEMAVKKRRKIINVMIMGAKIITKDLSEIHAVARRLQYETESMPESMVGGGAMKKMAAVKKSLEELGGLANDYSRDTSWARAVALESIINFKI